MKVTVAPSVLGAAAVFVVAACSGGPRGSAHLPAGTASAVAASATPVHFPAWCTPVLSELAKTDAVVKQGALAHLESADFSRVGVLAAQLDREVRTLDAAQVALVRGDDGPRDALAYAASATHKASILAALLVTRKTGELADEPRAIARALYVAVQLRHRGAIVARGHCGPQPDRGNPSAQWQAAALAGFDESSASILPCAELATAAAAESPGERLVLVHLRPDGRPWLVAPASLDLEPDRWAVTDALYCIIRRLEETTYPAPGVEVTMSLPFELTPRR
jgi:hypothetical protein